jgi:hypothetical protein
MHILNLKREREREREERLPESYIFLAHRFLIAKALAPMPDFASKFEIPRIPR